MSWSRYIDIYNFAEVATGLPVAPAALAENFVCVPEAGKQVGDYDLGAEGRLLHFPGATSNGLIVFADGTFTWGTVNTGSHTVSFTGQDGQPRNVDYMA